MKLIEILKSDQPSNLDLGLLILRLGSAFFMGHHGFDKLMNFSAGSADFPDPIGLGPQISMALTILAEFFCALLVGLGLFTRWALIPLVICMFVIMFLLNPEIKLEDIEHAALYLVIYVALWFTGPGKYKVKI